ncbi:hypothetical protein ACHAW5_001530 [Stephanodiscus triporus]|uniref:Diacylglycerol O-acyltransferase n=1 Tax=Stephanodiscus triporus TaxID=2934178 RepID=A0ABD3P1B4_9STRA
MDYQGEGKLTQYNMFTGDKQRQSLLIGTLAFLAAATFLAFRKRGNGAKETKRRLSFTSVGLGLGSFPPKANVKEPIINVAVYFAKATDCPSSLDVAQLIIKPWLEYERLSQVPDFDRRIFRPSTLVEIKPVDLIREFHISGDEEFLNQTIVDHLQDTLGAGRDDLPWWEILIIRNAGAGPSACVLRVHHVIGDGLALVAAFEKLKAAEDGGDSNNIPSLSFKNGGIEKSANKPGTLSSMWSLLEATAHCLTLSATKYDDDTAFSRMNHSEMKHSGKRKAVFFPTVPLDFVKKLKTAAGVSVNDILMVAISQAIHDYCKLQNDEILTAKGSAVQCRGLLPVGFPRSRNELNDKSNSMRNKWCMVSCDMGVGHSDIEDRLRHIHAKTTEMKEKPRAFMQLQIQNELGPYVPLSVGPSEECLFAGKMVKSVQLFFDNLLTQVDLISYAGRVYGNIIFDSDQLPNFEDFGRLYVNALADLAKRLKVEAPSEVGKKA